MPIQLTTALDVGALDPNSPLQQAKIDIIELHIGGASAILTVAHGNTVSDEWVVGVPLRGKTVKKLTVDGADYAAIKAAASVGAGEVYYDEIAKLLYQWLIDNHADDYAGTIV